MVGHHMVFFSKCLKNSVSLPLRLSGTRKFGTWLSLLTDQETTGEQDLSLKLAPTDTRLTCTAGYVPHTSDLGTEWIPCPVICGWGWR